MKNRTCTTITTRAQKGNYSIVTICPIHKDLLQDDRCMAQEWLVLPWDLEQLVQRLGRPVCLASSGSRWSQDLRFRCRGMTRSAAAAGERGLPAGNCSADQSPAAGHSGHCEPPILGTRRRQLGCIGPDLKQHLEQT